MMDVLQRFIGVKSPWGRTVAIMLCLLSLSRGICDFSIVVVLWFGLRSKFVVRQIFVKSGGRPSTEKW
jgi:hypothetical protein